MIEEQAEILSDLELTPEYIIEDGKPVAVLENSNLEADGEGLPFNGMAKVEY